jgi:hypothetical protein
MSGQQFWTSVICNVCRQQFWYVYAEQKDGYTQNYSVPACPHCEKVKSLVSTRLPDNVERELTGHLIQRRDLLVADLAKLLEAAFAPIKLSEQTSWDKFWRGDAQYLQLQEKYNAQHYANVLIKQRTELVQNLKAMILEMGKLENVELETQLKLLKARVEFQKLANVERQLEVERLKLEEEIAKMHALQQGHIETLQLEETNRQVRLLAEINPPPPAPEPTKKSRVKQAISDHRNEFRAKATAKQLVLSDFLKELQKVFRANVEDSEKAARIRAVMEGYKQEVEALPRGIREFLERVERGEEPDRD